MLLTGLWSRGQAVCCQDHPELHARYDALPSTSIGVERLHAIGRRVDDSGGMQRYENRAGVSLAMYNDQAGWAEKEQAAGSLAGLLGQARAAARKARTQTQKQRRIAAGRAKMADRETKLTGKRARREKKKAEQARISTLELKTFYSELTSMGVDDLKDQLRAYRQQGKSGFMLTYKKRGDYVLAVQTLMCEAIGAGANDLKDGDSGVEGRAVRRRKVVREDDGSGSGGGKAKKAKKQKQIVSLNGYEWFATERFKIEKVIGKMIAIGEVPGRENVKKGTILYKVQLLPFAPHSTTDQTSYKHLVLCI